MEVRSCHPHIQAPVHQEDWLHSCRNVSAECVTELYRANFQAPLDKEEYPVSTRTVDVSLHPS